MAVKKVNDKEMVEILNRVDELEDIVMEHHIGLCSSMNESDDWSKDSIVNAVELEQKVEVISLTYLIVNWLPSEIWCTYLEQQGAARLAQK